jgi:hypothetical protein
VGVDEDVFPITLLTLYRVPLNEFICFIVAPRIIVTDYDKDMELEARLVKEAKEVLNLASTGSGSGLKRRRVGVSSKHGSSSASRITGDLPASSNKELPASTTPK